MMITSISRNGAGMIRMTDLNNPDLNEINNTLKFIAHYLGLMIDELRKIEKTLEKISDDLNKNRIQN